MTYVPSVRHDVFICHAHNDDGPRGRGWVSQFKEDVEASLRRRLGPQIDVFMDDELAPDERYRGRLEEDIRSSALFIPIMSPSLILSEFCLDELNWFTESARPPSGNQHASLIFKSVLLPDLGGMYRYWCKGLTNVDFFISNRGVQIALDRTMPEYRAQIEYLSGKIAARLEDLKGQCDPVFLVSISSLQLSNEVRKLEAELRDDGHRVLPGVYIPDFSQARDLLSAQISESKYCVFLLNSEYNQQISELSEIAKEKRKRAVFWISPNDYKGMTHDQTEFVKGIEREGLEVYQNNFATQFYDRLKLEAAKSLRQPGTESAQISNNVRLYVISNQKGSKQERASQLARQIEYENSLHPQPVILPPLQPVLPPDEPPSEFSRRHAEILNGCDAVLIYSQQQGEGDEKWLRDTWTEIKDRKGDGQAEYRSRAIFIAHPPNEDRAKTVRDLRADEEVIGKAAATRTLETERQFDEAKLHRFLTGLT
jgi:hypothetical protein